MDLAESGGNPPNFRPFRCYKAPPRNTPPPGSRVAGVGGVGGVGGWAGGLVAWRLVAWRLVARKEN